MVEAVFLLPMFVILFYASLFASKLSLTYISTTETSRENAWAMAMANCNDSGDDNVEELPPAASGGGAGAATKLSPMPNNPTTPPSGSIVGAVSGLLQKVVNFLPISADAAQSTNEASINWRQPNLYAKTPGGGTTKVSRSVTVVCNERPKDGGAVNTMILLAQDLGSLLSSALGGNANSGGH